jgi:arylsulfatase A-like enzyme
MHTLTQVKHWQAAVAFKFVLAALLGTLLGTMVLAAADQPPNVLFIILDDVGIDQMRIFGYSEDNQPRTPNIDTIAHAGVRFRNAWAMPECSPSRVSFFTGRYPLRTGVVTFITDVDLAQSQASPFEVTTPQVLRTRGYTNALFGKWHLTGIPNRGQLENEQGQPGAPNPGNPAGNAAPHVMGWDFYFGDLEAAPRALDTTAGGVAPAGTYTCGFVTDAAFGACYVSDGSCTAIGRPEDPKSAGPGRACLEQGGILVPEAACQATVPPQVKFDNFNGYYVAPLDINYPDGAVELVAGFQDDGFEKPPTDPRARQYLTTQQTNAAISWIQQQSGKAPWMATLSFSAAHVPVQQPPKALLPSDSVDSSRFDCTKLGDQRILYNQMIEAMDTEIGRLLVEVGLAARTPDGQLDYRPEQTNTMVVIVGDNGSYLQTVKLPFDPLRSKGSVYQTGVWVPLIVAGPLVDRANVGREVRHMVNAAVDVFALFGEIAGLDVRRVVPRSHALDARPMLPYVTTPGQASIRAGNFTQAGTSLKAPGVVIPPCVVQLADRDICLQLFTFQALCESENGTWYGPGGAAGPDGLPNCCAVEAQTSLPNFEILAHDAWAVRDDHFKLVRKQVENCAANQLELQYEFYTIDDAAPVPKLDLEGNNLLTAPTLPPQGLTPDQQQHFDVLLAELLAILRSEPACPGDGNLDKRVNQEDIANWEMFADICASEPAKCSSVYDLNLDAVTDSADLVIIQQNFGRRCGVRGFLR